MKYWIIDKNILIIKPLQHHEGITAIAKTQDKSHIYLLIDQVTSFYAYGSSQQPASIGSIKHISKEHYALELKENTKEIEIVLFDKEGKVLKHLNIKL